MSPAKKILIVDDDAFIRRPLEFILHAEGFDAATACDGEECLRAVQQHKPDLIFLDVMMPGRDGFTICSALKQDPRHADIPVILLSARGQDSDRERGLSVGALDFLTKPYSPSDLIRRVREVLFDSGDDHGTQP